MPNIYAQLGKRIKLLRERLEISQQKLADTMKLPRPAISQIENGTRTIAADELIKLSQIFRVSIESILELKKDPEIVLEETKPVKKKKEKPQLRINVPQKNVEKFKEVLLYILQKVGSRSNIGETVVYKLLYFIDFDYYEKYEEQLIGATYQKNHFGPTPVEFHRIVDSMIGKDLEKVKSPYFAYEQTKYLPIRKPDLSKLTTKELELIDDVLNRLSDMNATLISQYSHHDVPWLVTEEGDIIEYESVFYRTPAYSVREYPKDVQ